MKKKEKKEKRGKEFNVIICGVGGQGVMTLLRVLAEAALVSGYEIRTSELHGLSQRGGSIQAHIRFGRKIYSPLISPGKVDLILTLEMTEALRTASLASKETIFLINKKFIPYFGSPSEKSVLTKIKGLGENSHLVEAGLICREKIGKEVLAGIYLLSYASFKSLIPIKPESLLKAIENTVAEKYLSINKKTFKLAQKTA